MIPLSQGPTDKEQIDVQGDISYDIVEFVTDTWPDVIYFNSLLFYSLSLMVAFGRAQIRMISIYH